MKRCKCGVLFNHATSDQCGLCGERNWPCGHARAPEQDGCDVPLCRRRNRVRVRATNAAQALEFKRRRTV
jgi:hypothetical protein